MKPPVCRVCHKDLGPDEGGLVCFAKRPSDRDWDRRAAGPGFTGHPPDCDWFCGEHHGAALEHSHLPIDEAMGLIK